MSKYTALLLIICSFGVAKESRACHALALVNYMQQQYVAGVGLQVRADSDAANCGCATYWIDCEVRAAGDVFDAAAFAPGFHGPLTSFPYYQSAQMSKPNCTLQSYPWITIPDSDLCNGVTYEYRMRENHNGQVGPWTPIMTFVATNGTGGSPSGVTYDFIYQDNCLNDSVIFTSTSSGGGGSIYQWDLGDGSPAQNGTSIKHQYSTSGLFNVTLVAGNNTACAQTIVHQVSINPNPIADFMSSAGSICDSACVNFIDNSTLASGTIASYLWDFDDNGAISSNQNPNYCYSNVMDTSTLLISPSLVVVSDSGCADSVEFVDLIELHPELVADYTYDFNCENDSTEFYSMSPSAGAITQYEWDFGNGNLGSGQNTGYSYNIEGWESIVLVVTDTNNCTDTTAKNVYINPAPSVSFGFAPPLDCGENCVTFTDSSAISSGNIVFWSWDFDDGYSSILQFPSHCYLNTGATPLEFFPSLQVESDSGCINHFTASNPITVLEEFVAPNLAYNGTDLIISDFDSIQWYVNGISVPFNDSSYTVSSTGNHYAAVWNEFGCRAFTDTLFITYSSISDLSTSSYIVYPNPAQNYLNVETNITTDYQLIIYDLSGRIVSEKKAISSMFQIDIADLSSGQYLLKISATKENCAIPFVKLE